MQVSNPVPIIIAILSSISAIFAYILTQVKKNIETEFKTSILKHVEDNYVKKEHLDIDLLKLSHSTLSPEYLNLTLNKYATIDRVELAKKEQTELFLKMFAELKDQIRELKIDFKKDMDKLTQKVDTYLNK